MGWIFSLVTMIGYVINGDPIWLITAGLFAISGGLSEVAVSVKKMAVLEMEVEEDEFE